ncbi:type II toxin-antitoxin system PemK/MazF family toxin [Microcella sp.]|uniref:type II toxin-antitoxin system PemK/MazF family toxin n=1 Tax=Microcella sp. TaxID=1913979 RepID=UPI00256BD02C|nr:type II toxin-antitoxin system PemK/MazF family toxin [Microcella sp.]MBX9472287.1 type II toxin-antitoxin system PemK/MazF family toxin [Microcella sp.]
MKRGEIRLVAGGVYASKPRPAVVMQDDLFAALDSVTVCPLTTTVVDAPLLRVLIPATENSGVDADSYAMVDKLTTVRRANVGTRVGEVTAQQLTDLERRILVFLGIAR